MVEFDGSESAPLTAAQEGIWYHQSMFPEVPLYNVPVVVELRGEVDVDAMRRAWQAASVRHPMLRARLSAGAGRLVQMVDARPPALELLSMADRNEQALAACIAGLVARSFGDVGAPLAVATLVAAAADFHVLVVVLHHVVADFTSATLVRDELARAYTAAVHGEDLPTLPASSAFLSFARAAQERSSAAGDERAMDFWVSALGQVERVLQLPADHLRPQRPSFRVAHVAGALGDEQVAGLRAISRTERATPFMVLLAAYEAFLHRLSGQASFAVGVPVQNRPPQLADEHGCFVNVVAHACDMHGRPSFRQLVQRVRSRAIASAEWSSTPFEAIVHRLNPQRELSTHPIFQAAMNFVVADADAPAFGSLATCVVWPRPAASKFDISLTWLVTPGAVECHWDLAADLFEQRTAERFWTMFRSLLDDMLAAPDAAVSSFASISACDRGLLERFARGPRLSFARDSCIHELFEARVREQPDATAIVFEGRRLTYAELNTRANRLAHGLRALGVGTDSRVAVIVERGIGLMVAVLGVLKAGSAFLPLDPLLPIERLRSMLASARPSALVSIFGTACAMEAIGAAAGPVIVLDCEGCAERLQEQAASDLPAASIGLTSRHLAYVTYTSGSSGRPKGVAVEHRGVCNLAAYQQATFCTAPGDRVLQFAAPTFDVFVWDWVWGLCSGAELHLASREDLLPGAPLLRTLASARITHLMLPPAVLGALPDDADLQSVGVLGVAGEACPLAVARRWGNGRRFANLYGPTETTVIVSGQEVESPALLPPTIGGPVPNTELHVLDDWLNPVPVGVVGEIFVGGVQVARGYVGDPALTAQRFIPDPFTDTPGARLYRTGDLGFWRSDGQLEYRGRNDHQVKLRGYRIELEEIAGRLRQLPQVQDAIAIVVGSGEGRHIVAYAAVPDSTRQQRPALGQALRARLRETLPDYMLPAVVVIDAIPVNAHGKVDRGALPQHDTSTPDAAFEGPRSETERMLAALWAELLGRERVGVHDDFYDIGGHSLLALRAVERLHQVAANARPAIRDMLKFRTIAELATELDRRMTEAAGADRP